MSIRNLKQMKMAQNIFDECEDDPILLAKACFKRTGTPAHVIDQLDLPDADKHDFYNHVILLVKGKLPKNNPYLAEKKIEAVKPNAKKAPKNSPAKKSPAKKSAVKKDK